MSNQLTDIISGLTIIDSYQITRVFREVYMLPEKVTSLIGQTGDVIIMEIEKGAIKRYAHAVGDFNPLYLDEECARNSEHGSIIAPPGFFGWPSQWAGHMPAINPLATALIAALSEAGFPRLLDGGTEYEFFYPIRAGDTLALQSRITRISDRETRSGKLVFSVFESAYTNQSGALVARTRWTLITR